MDNKKIMETVNIKLVVLSYFSLIDRNRARKIVSRRSTIISCSVILFSQSEYRLKKNCKNVKINIIQPLAAILILINYLPLPLKP